MSILLISGSTRAHSANTALLRTAADLDASATLYGGLAALPAFNPDDDGPELPAIVARLRQAVSDCDAIVFCTPEYAGTLPGSPKNLLDWLVGGSEITGKPVAWVSTAAGPHRGRGATQTLQTVLGYVQARPVQEACGHIAVPRGSVGTGGLITDPAIRTAISEVLRALRDAL